MTFDVLRVIWKPAFVMERVAAQDRIYTGLIVVFLTPFLGLLGYFSWVITGTSTLEIEARFTLLDVLIQDLGRGLPPGFPLDQIILAVTAAIWFLPWLDWWLTISVVMHIVTGRLGGRGSFRATLDVIGVACLPFTVFQILTFASNLMPEYLANVTAWFLLTAQVLTLVWHVALLIVGMCFARRIDYVRSAGSCGISCIALLGLFILLIVLGLGLTTVLDRLIG